MFYKVTVKAEYRTIAPRGYTELGSYEALVTLSLTNQYITMFYVCFSLNTSYLTCIVDSLILTSQPTAL